MAKRKTQPSGADSTAPNQPEKSQGLPKTTHTGVNATDTKSVLVSAVLEIHGQVRFGDGTDVGLTVTETDMVVSPDGNQVHKLIWAGSKRRGVDRRTIHELRDQHWSGIPCYIPNLCGECPICWLYGFTGTTQKKDINAKSRVLYASSVSVEEVQVGLNTHSRNQVDEKTQTTAGAAGIHAEEVIVAGVHFPTYTALVHVLDWEIGAFAHALLENVNSNRYTAASRAQGGIKFAEHEGVPLIIVDESSQGVFPLSAPKIPGWESDWPTASQVFQGAMSVEALKAALEQQGFTVTMNGRTTDTPNRETTPDSAPDNAPTSDNTTENPEEKHTEASVASNQLVIGESEGVITVKCGNDVLMTRYVGAKALGYLRQKQLAAKQKLSSLKVNDFQTDIQSYLAAISSKSGAVATVPTGCGEEAGGGSEDGTTDESE